MCLASYFHPAAFDDAQVFGVGTLNPVNAPCHFRSTLSGTVEGRQEQ